MTDCLHIVGYLEDYEDDDYGDFEGMTLVRMENGGMPTENDIDGLDCAFHFCPMCGTQLIGE